MSHASIPLHVRKGAYFGKALAWGQGVSDYASIQDVVLSAPMRIIAPGHGIPDCWVVRVESIKGLRGLNLSALQPVRVVDENTIELPDVNASLVRGHYTGGGHVRFNRPMDLNGYAARMQVREYAAADDVVLELTTENGGIVIDTEKSAVVIQIAHERTVDMPYRAGVYDVEMIAPGGQVHVLASGEITFTDEVTRDA